jgi:purine-binding chemotaxis protein CheW
VTDPDALGQRAAELRRGFDAAFAEAPAAARPLLVDLLAIRVGDQRSAVRLEEVERLFADHPLTALPSTHPELAGLATARGTTFPVFDLRRLLGLPATGPARWTVLVRAPVAFGVAFDELEGHLRVPPEALLADEAPADRPRAVVADGVVRPLVGLVGLLDPLTQRLGRSATKDR